MTLPGRSPHGANSELGRNLGDLYPSDLFECEERQIPPRLSLRRVISVWKSIVYLIEANKYNDKKVTFFIRKGLIF